MPLQNTYADGYIAAQVTQDREGRAIADIAQYGALPADWVTRLTIIRAYIITCLECAKHVDDMWSAKLVFYRKEFDTALQQARVSQSVIDAQNVNSAGAGSYFTVQLLRA